MPAYPEEHNGRRHNQRGDNAQQRNPVTISMTKKPITKSSSSMMHPKYEISCWHYKNHAKNNLLINSKTPRDGAQGVVNLTIFWEKLTLIRHQFERVFQHINV